MAAAVGTFAELANALTSGINDLDLSPKVGAASPQRSVAEVRNALLSDVPKVEDTKGQDSRRVGSRGQKSVVGDSSNARDLKRGKTTVGGVERPFRLDTQEVLADQLNTLVREVRNAEVFRQQRDMNRNVKNEKLGRVVNQLREERLRHSLQRTDDYTDESWRSVIVRKPRTNKDDSMAYVAPELRHKAMRALEDAISRRVWKTKAPSPPASAMGTPRSSAPGSRSTAARRPRREKQDLPSQQRMALAEAAGFTGVVAIPGGDSWRPARYWDVN
eukprot:TRINITY_DN2616_c0_g5_i1.p1 TRINITY_DN2616_c0_g5~~TRINITY_DN2616_c0_g5_i1.p1  ORF type:complete len:274 (+),score=35.09 TRINITY_DN2616_c0_g5_i1:60-881(+)